MNHEFWHERWQQNQIGFHREDINPNLLQHWFTLAVPTGSRVFVPMCGKSKDLLWLVKQGYQVVGIELSPIAVKAFFDENQLPVHTRQQGNFLISETEQLQLFCGDFFALTADDLGSIDAVYDRASLIALPDTMREDYVTTMARLLTAGTKQLLIAIDYPPDEISGPPFSVPLSSIQQLYQAWCDIELLQDQDVLEQELHLKNRGLSQLREQIYQLTVKELVMG